MNAVIQGAGLHKIYAQGTVAVPALRGVDLHVDAGEFTALVGPSGSGKSTLLNLVGTLDKATSGTIAVAGRDVTTLSRAASATFRLNHIGFVFQAYNLLPVLTAYENAEYTLVLKGVAASERAEMPPTEELGVSDVEVGTGPRLSTGAGIESQRDAAISLHGLMALPPPRDAWAGVNYFAELARLRDEMLRLNLLPTNGGELSMGTSADYRDALAQGATWVRIGSALLGERLER